MTEPRTIPAIQADLEAVEQRMTVAKDDSRSILQAAGQEWPDGPDEAEAVRSKLSKSNDKAIAGAIVAFLEASAERAKLLGELEEARQADRARRETYIRSLVDKPGATERTFGAIRKDPTVSLMTASRDDVRSAAFRAVERVAHPAAQDRLDRLIRDESDHAGLAARYIAAVGDPAYSSAFVRALAEPATAHLGLLPTELAAMREVRAVMSARGMTSFGTSTGGYASPLEIDSSILLSNDGGIHPFRELATVRQMVGRELRLITSEGATVGYAEEGTAITDGAPAFSQPVVHAERGAGLIDFSIEYGQDVPDALEQLGAAMRDARDVLDATKLVSGAGHGSHEPQGILVGADANIDTGSLTVESVESLAGSLGARFSPGATFVSNMSTLLALRALVGSADADDQPLVNESMDRILGRPWREASAMETGILVLGNFKKGFVIADRIGTTIELIPHRVNGDGNPTGERGLLAIWRSGSLVTIADAFVGIDASAS